MIIIRQVIQQAVFKMIPAYELHPLTELMQDSLEYNSKTFIIACVSPLICDLAKTRQTLEYALKTGTITNKPSKFGLQPIITKELER